MSSKSLNAATAFLGRWQPACPWVLTSIEPGRGAIETRGFDPADEAAAARWITHWQDFDATQGEPRNIYFGVNLDARPFERITSKARKRDIAAVVCLHADMDPYKGESAKEGRARVLNALTTDLPEGVPGPPTAINLSGNGFNAFWRLKSPAVIHGDITKALDIERHNRGLALAFGGDMTTDVSRIMRLPGTINYPDRGKKSRGLKPVLARQVYHDDTLLYDLDAFAPADAPACSYESSAKIEIGAAVSVDDLDDLDVPERTRVIISAGAYPGETRASRSEWLFAAICSMIRAGEPDEVILGIITDPTWAISASVIEKPDPETYARRQILRAHQWLTSKMKEEFDE